MPDRLSKVTSLMAKPLPVLLQTEIVNKSDMNLKCSQGELAKTQLADSFDYVFHVVTDSVVLFVFY